MTTFQTKLPLFLKAVFSFMALTILLDFALPGRVVQDKILEVKSERQQHYNASGNYHYSYKIITQAKQFSVPEYFANQAQEGEDIEYAVSLIFKEVNWYRLFSSDGKSYYSLRILTGLVLPLLILFLFYMVYQYRWKIKLLVFILQLLLIVDLVFLIGYSS